MRQIVLDTETTGLDPAKGHRLIEIGCIELMNRLPTGHNFHYYINPQRDIDEGAQAVHGISSEFLQDKPLFADIQEELLAYLTDAELVIHNAPFDIGFLNHEYRLLNPAFPSIEQLCTITDTLVMARKRHPGQKNNLDALCKRYHVDNSNRQLHGALLDAQILADVYLMMTGGQTTLFNPEQSTKQTATERTISIRKRNPARAALPVIYADASELAAHDAFMQHISQRQG